VALVVSASDNSIELSSRTCTVANHAPAFVSCAAEEFCSDPGDLRDRLHVADRPDPTHRLAGRYDASYRRPNNSRPFPHLIDVGGAPVQ
jgi:hypothetical protein